MKICQIYTVWKIQIFLNFNEPISPIRHLANDKFRRLRLFTKPSARILRYLDASGIPSSVRLVIINEFFRQSAMEWTKHCRRQFVYNTGCRRSFRVHLLNVRVKLDCANPFAILQFASLYIIVLCHFHIF